MAMKYKRHENKISHTYSGCHIAISIQYSRQIALIELGEQRCQDYAMGLSARLTWSAATPV